MLNSLKLNLFKFKLVHDSLVVLKNNISTSGNDNNLLLLNYLINRSLTSTTNTTKLNNVNNVKEIIENKNQSEFGFLFDIDGVLVRGKTPLPHTKDCIRLLTDNKGNFKVPTIFVTNAGNELRSTKAAKLSNLLGVKIKADQVVMSHSPLKLLKSFHNKRCLISGQGPIVDIAKNLGFNSLITIDELRQFHPNLDVVDHKRRNFAPCVLGRYCPPIEAIILFGESVRWETNLQLLIDVLMSNGQLDSPPKKFPQTNLPILACNTDMIWMAEAAMPRFGHGTFLHCLEQIYQKLSGRELKYHAIVGKPSEITYYYAESVLKKHAESIGIFSNIKRMYAIGDNLDTDIYGANVYNQILENNKRYREKMSQSQQSIKVNAANGSSAGRIDLNDEVVTQQSQQQINSNEQTLSFMDKENDFISTAESISSILVRTGVFQGDMNDLNNHNVDLALAHKDMIIDPSLIKPRFISDNAYQAVKSVFELENFKN